MKLAQFDRKERQVIYECLKAAVEGPFFPEWEFHTLFGIERKEVAGVLKSWPRVDESNEVVVLAIANSMANLVGYPHHEETKWREYISVSPADVVAILRKYRSA